MKQTRRMIHLWIGSTLLVVGSLYAQESDTSTKLADVLANLNEHQTAIATASGKIVTLQQEIRDANQRISDIEEIPAEDRSELIELEYLVIDLRDQRDAVRERTDTLYEMMTSHLQSVHRSRQKHYLRNLLPDEKETPLIKEETRRKKYDDYYTKAVAERYSDSRDYLEYVEIRLESELNERTRLDELNTSFSSEKTDLEEKIQSNREEILQLEGEINELQRLVNSLIRERMTLERQLSNPSYAGDSDITSEGSSTQWPIKGEVIQSFGSSRADGRLKWEGIQFSSAPDTTVVAVARGNVVYADNLRGYGMVVMIDHGNRLITLYGNCNEIYVSNGDTVEAGEAIGIAGKDGEEQTRSLYFEVRDNGRAIDPAKWLDEN